MQAYLGKKFKSDGHEAHAHFSTQMQTAQCKKKIKDAFNKTYNKEEINLACLFGICDIIHYHSDYISNHIASENKDASG